MPLNPIKARLKCVEVANLYPIGQRVILKAIRGTPEESNAFLNQQPEPPDGKFEFVITALDARNSFHSGAEYAVTITPATPTGPTGAPSGPVSA